MAGDSGSEGVDIDVGKPLPPVVDWIAAVLIGLGGLLFATIGTVVRFALTREVLAEEIEAGRITVTLLTADLSDTQMLTVVSSITSWTGLGLLVTGVGAVVFAIGFVLRRRRARSRAADGEPPNGFGAHAVIGAVLTLITSFVPFSPGIGGAVAGYLERGESTRTISVGALSGLLAMLPAVVVLLFLLVGLGAGLAAVGETGLAIAAVAVVMLASMFVATLGAGLGALGGYVGGKFAESRADT